MAYDITDNCIIEEYLSNWFTYEELAKYLCISYERVEHLLNNSKKIINEYGLQKLDKILTHKSYIYRESIGEKEKLLTSDDIKIIDIANYIIDNNASIRDAAKKFNIGKTTVFDYINEKLPNISIKKYKEVFLTLMAHKSFSTNNKAVIEQVLRCYILLNEGFSSKEICERLNIGRNILQRNLTTRLEKIDKEKFEYAKGILKENKFEPLSEHYFKHK